MCGVIAAFGKGARERVERAIPKLRHRGPDAEGVVVIGDVALGHTRLAILDLDRRSDQPFRVGDLVLSYNGELWNYREVRAALEALGDEFTTSGDTEVVARALARWGVDALHRFEGMFALAWTVDGAVLHLARDRFGEVPLHVFVGREFTAASELKALVGLDPRGFDMVGPGERFEVSVAGFRRVRWYAPRSARSTDERPAAAAHLYDLVGGGAVERTISDVPVCTLLSGGIDSAVVAHHLKRFLPGLVAYTAVYDERSADLRAARVSAEAIGVELREVKVPVPCANDLARVVEIIEQPNKAQVEIGWACLRLADAIRADGFKVTFSGEGSDELWASYGFAYHGVKEQGWFAYREGLFLEQHRKNFARCNKVFMSRSIECRLPFLSTPLVEYALSLSQEVVAEGKSRPKAVLQDAFTERLPEHVLRRPKTAFQDGMGLKEAIAGVIPDPRRFYAAEYERRFGK